MSNDCKRSAKPKGRRPKQVKLENRGNIEGNNNPEFVPDDGWVECLSANQWEMWDFINLIQDDNACEAQWRNFWLECCKAEEEKQRTSVAIVQPAQLDPELNAQPDPKEWVSYNVDLRPYARQNLVLECYWQTKMKWKGNSVERECFVKNHWKMNQKIKKRIMMTKKNRIFK